MSIGPVPTRTALDRNGEPELGPTRVATVTGNYFATLGVGTAAGRSLTAADDRVLGAHPVAVISHRFWQQRLDRDPNVLSDMLTLNGTTFSIVGVAAAGFSGDWVGRPAEQLRQADRARITVIPGARREDRRRTDSLVRSRHCHSEPGSGVSCGAGGSDGGIARRLKATGAQTVD